MTGKFRRIAWLVWVLSTIYITAMAMMPMPMMKTRIADSAWTTLSAPRNDYFIILPPSKAEPPLTAQISITLLLF